jgi:hypothetical protein
LSLLSSSYSDASGSGLGVLQSTYGEDDESDQEGSSSHHQHSKMAKKGPATKVAVVEVEDEKEDDDEEEEVEKHDLFSVLMTEHLAKNLSELKVEEQLEAFCKHILLSEPFLNARYKMIQELQLLIQKQYPKCAIYPCGPDYIGIGCSDDAVLVFVDLFGNKMC